jgi:hypothetical protein
MTAWRALALIGALGGGHQLAVVSRDFLQFWFNFSPIFPDVSRFSAVAQYRRLAPSQEFRMPE